jgi:cytoskeletal protein CcmA (bactofilin family)
MGHVNGKIVVSELLSLKETAKIVGEIKTKTLMIEPKAIFSGTCDMSQTVSTPQPKA